MLKIWHSPGTCGFHLIGGGLACRIAGQALLACFQKLLRPTVIQAIRDALATARRGNTLLATQTFKHDTYFLFRRIMPARLATDKAGASCHRYSGSFSRPSLSCSWISASSSFPSVTTMSQKSSLMKTPQYVPGALTSDSPGRRL